MRLSKRSIHGGARSFFGRGVSFVAVVLFFTLLASVALAPIGERVAAASVRIASIVSVSGTVEVKKSGGKKYFKAYKDMPLNAGDHLKTGNKSTVTIKVQDRADEATLGGGSSLYISELRDSSGKKKSNFTLWTGSMWVKASTLVSTEDEFEVETPTAVMGVRGTNLFVAVDPKTGESMFMIASGVGEVQSKNAGKKDDKPALLYPNQMVNTYFDGKKKSEKDEVVPVSLEQFVQTAGPGVIEAIIRNKAAIDKENEELLERLRQELDSSAGIDPEQAEALDMKSISDLERLRENARNLVANLVNEAIRQKKLDPDEARKLVDEANRSLDNKIDLVNAKGQELSDKEKEKQRVAEQARQARERMQQQAEEEKARQQSEQQRLLDQIAESTRRIQEANERALAEQKRKAEEAYLKKLQEEKLKEYQEAKKKLEQENAGPAQTPTPVSTPNTPPQPTPTPLAINQPGTIEGPLEQTVSGSSSVYYGPSNGIVTIAGDLTLTGESTATGSYTLRNMVIEGNLIVNVPSGSVVLEGSVSVAGSTSIDSISGGFAAGNGLRPLVAVVEPDNGFISSAEHGNLIVNDEDGATIRLKDGARISGDLHITGGGQVLLHGVYHNDVYVDAATELRIAGDAKVMASLHIVESDVELDVQGKVLEIVTGQQVEATASVQAAQEQIEQYKQDIMFTAFNTMENGEDLSKFKQSLEAAGFELERTIDLYLLFNHLYSSYPQSLLDVKAWLKDWGELENPAPDFNQGDFTIENTPYGQQPRFVYSGYTPPAGNEGQGNEPSFEWPNWFQETIGVTLSQVHNGEVIERYYPINSLACVIEFPDECWHGDMTMFHPGEATVTIHGGRYEWNEDVWNYEYVYDDIILPFTIELPEDLTQNREWEATHFVYGDSDQIFDWSNPEYPEMVDRLWIRGSGSGTYTLQNIVITNRLIVDIPNGSLVIGDNVRFDGMGMDSAPEIEVQNVNAAANGGLVMNNLADYIKIYVNDSNEARLSVQTSPEVTKPAVMVEGPGALELVGTYEFVDVVHYMEGEQGSGSQVPSFRDIHIAAGTLIEYMSISSNTSNIRLVVDELGSILSLAVMGEPDEGHDASITNYEEMLSDLLSNLNESLTEMNYDVFRPQFESVLAFIGYGQEEITQSGAAMWVHLKNYGQSGYQSLQHVYQTLKLFGLNG